MSTPHPPFAPKPAQPRARTQQAAGGTQSIQRSVAVLREIAAHWPKGCKLGDIAAALGLEAGTVQRIVKGLLFEGMVRRMPGTRHYQLGHVAYELGLAAASGHPLREICQPVLARLVKETGDPVFLLVRSGLDAVCIDHLRGTFPIQPHTLDIGSRRPLGVTAGALALLMEQSAEEIEHIIQANSQRGITHARLDEQRLRASVAESQKLGYALNDEDVLPGVSAVGLPLRTPGGSPYAAVSIASISSRMSGERRGMLVQALAGAVKELEAVVAQHRLDWR